MARTALLCALLCLATTSTAEAAKTKRRAKDGPKIPIPMNSFGTPNPGGGGGSERPDPTSPEAWAVGQQIFNDMYRDAVQASEKGDLRQAMEKYLQCIQVLTPPDGVISATNGGNGLHVHLFNQLAKVMMSDQMLEGAEEYSERAADLGEALLKKRRDELKRKPDAAMDEEGEEEEEQEEDEGEKAAPKSKFDDKVRDETERDEVRKAYRNLALIASHQQRFEDAVEAMKALLKLAKHKAARADAYKEIGILYLRQANLAAAVEALEEAVDLDADVPKGYSNLAIAYTRMFEKSAKPSDAKEALSMFELALDVEPESVSLHTNYGILLAQLNDFQFAQMALKEALRLDPAFKLARDNLQSVEDIIAQSGGLDKLMDGGGSAVRHKPLMKRYIGPTPKVQG